MRFLNEIKIGNNNKSEFSFAVEYLYNEFQNIKQKIDFDKLKDELKTIEETLLNRLSFDKNDFTIEKRKNKLDSMIRFINEIEQEFEIIKSFLSEINIDDISNEIFSIAEKIEQFINNLCFSAENDKKNCIVELQAGAGGVDSQDWTEMMFKMYTSWANKSNMKVEIIEISEGDGAGFRSCSFSIIGKNAYGILKNENGIHRMVRLSPFNSKNKRQTNFASFYCYPEIDDSVSIDINDSDLKIETYRSSGAGGQHVNTTDSAVRILHIPTGVVVKSQNQRSQHQNKSHALKMLKNRLSNMKKDEELKKSSEQRSSKVDIEWGGSQVRNYIIHPYNLVKDLRSGFESANISSILQGDIDDILKSLIVNYISFWYKILRIYFMIAFLSLIKKELLSTIGNPKERFVIIVPVILQLIVFSKVATMDVKNIKIGVINRDIGHYGSKILEGMYGTTDAFESIEFLKNKQEAIDKIDSSKINGYIYIPYDFTNKINQENSPSILTIFNGSKLNSAAITSSYVNSIVSSVYMEIKKKNNQNNDLKSKINIRYWFNPTLEFMMNMLPTLLISITGMSALNIAGLSLAKEKELGTMSQLLISPATSNQIIFSKLTNTVLISLIQGFICFLFIIYIFGVKFQGSILLIFLTVFLVVLTMGSIGLTVSALSTTQQQSTINSLFITIPLMNTAGFSAPFENMPLILQKISYLLNPLAHGVFMCRGIFLKNIDFFTILQNFLQLLLILLGSTLVSIYFFRKRIS